MNASTLPIPGLRWGHYPERSEPSGLRPWRRAPLLAWGWPGGLRSRAEQAAHQATALQGLSAQAFAAQGDALQQRMLQQGWQREVLVQACAHAAEAARRALGWVAYVEQLMAALALLDNQMAEMATGEGKSLAAALAAGVGALAGIPVHVLTANDYLVERDANTFAPFYALLGLRVAFVTARQSAETRRVAYAQPVVYATAREVAFDYLRDRLRHGAPQRALQRRVQALAAPDGAQPLLRGLCMAVIDEADNILIDEAQMPLVLTREVAHASDRAFLWQAYALSARLAAEVDYRLQADTHRVQLTEAGRARIGTLTAPLGPLWLNARHRDETLATALTARHALARDRDYVLMPSADVQGGQEIVIVDTVSGRIAEGRKWSRGLHALVSIKEGCKVPAEMETLAQITFQRFFRRYHRLGGMSGTLFEARAELRSLYGCGMVQVPLRLPSQRLAWPARLYADDSARCRAAVERTRALVATGRPVLIGCDSVEASQAMAQALGQAGIAHAVLNAHFDAEEADIVARAGQRGQVTVATNMAGRGTDIHVDAAALAAGGLHVLSCQRNASQRHDRQLLGRAARQGEPGSGEVWLVLNPNDMYTSGLRSLASPDGQMPVPAWLQTLWRQAAQYREESRRVRRRRQLFRNDLAMDDGLSFCGSTE
ncbi:protein translocase subunit SecA [Comamonadaceae bacterium OS-1]|nr:protein translocase subunit SecA [Comamonadaceae bacterium OS-1]